MYQNQPQKFSFLLQNQWQLKLIPMLTGCAWVIIPMQMGLANTLNSQESLTTSGNSMVSAKPLTGDKLQIVQIPPGRDIPPPQDVTPGQPGIPELETPRPIIPLPSPGELLNPQTPPPPSQIDESAVPSRIFVKQFVVEGSTIYKPEKFAEILEKYTNRELSFVELLEARSQITKLYVDNGYVTTGAIIPPQEIKDGIVKIQVIEGELEAIKVSGVSRLNPNYIRSRLQYSIRKPVNVPQVLEALRTLQLDPLIENLSAELGAGVRPGTNVLEVRIQEADSFRTEIVLDNGRSPSVGTFRRRVQISEGNLLGWGDGLSVGYTNTDGSNAFDASYSLPINPRNGTINFSYSVTANNVIEAPFNDLDIVSNSRTYELTYRQPLYQRPSGEFTIGFTASRRESETSLLDTPFPLSPGADDQGRVRVSALRFFQEWSQRDTTQVFAARSQFSIGVGAFDATINDNAPDSRFYLWRGQAQWVRLLAPDTLLLIRGDAQIADRPLLSSEQFGLGGLGSVRGYRQDFLLTDNGAIFTTEVRLPVWKQRQNLLHIIPFIDIGTAWNKSGNEARLDNNTLASIGLGLQLNLGERFNARLDYGIPLISVDSRKNSWQENGIYFTISTTPF
ncbi:ShlB/FhaC/HecB family hemolysin secretion/activation protein [Calothrix sp. NIES-3974]|uniref:ShlB/FhaC/HecB family hemolysin secretion/activation protein n=1 Tax=Calothrix sp. NIES-3974 TaxID=2005462 RepID=UPI000B616BC7|nr:ShlB/FhaC/HecB family hemolysin secretion/activation protein [Calothrix sp. NIES-3974]BAZ06820.1 surface antigen variable number [Calothrix sp. NIES-3974]